MIEIVIFIFVAAIVFPALIMPFTSGVREMGLTVTRETMDLLSQGEIERKLAPFHYSGADGWNSETIGGFGDFFSESYYIYVYPPDFNTETSAATDYKRFTIEVTHAGDEGEPLEIIYIKTNWY